jgi:SHS2 domain-containing protein
LETPHLKSVILIINKIINDATAITIFFRFQAEKSPGLLRIKLQKLTFWKNAINISLFFFLFQSCITLSIPSYFAKSNKISVKLGTIYIDPLINKGTSDIEILNILNFLVESTLNRDYSKLSMFVSSEKGLYIDLKAHLSYADLLKEVNKKDSYFEVFFFDTSKLKKEKKSEIVKTVRDVLVLSEGLLAELYYETESAVEVRLRFQKNKKFENDLNTMYFSKLGEKWYVERLF